MAIKLELNFNGAIKLFPVSVISLENSSKLVTVIVEICEAKNHLTNSNI